MRIIFFGNNERGVICLEKLIEAKKNIVGVVTLPDKMQPSWSRNVATIAKTYDLKTLQPLDVNTQDSVTQLKSLNPDLIVLAGYPRLVCEAIRSMPSLSCINLHASPLPNYRGAAPLNWMLINGERRGGISIIEADQGVDTGDILAQEFFEIAENDDYKSLLDLTLNLFPKLLLRTISNLQSGNLKRIKQNTTEGTFFTKRLPEDGLIKWDLMTSIQIHNMVRALVYPMPGAFTYIGEKKLIIEKTQPIKREYRGVSGRISANWPSGIIVMCKDRGLLVKNIRSQSNTLINARDVMPQTGFDLGYRIEK